MSTIITAPDDATRTQLLMLAEIVKTTSRAGDYARQDIVNPPLGTGIGNGTWTRVTGALAELGAQVAVYRQLGGPELPSNVEKFALDFCRMGTPPEQVVGESMSVIAVLKAFAENLPRRESSRLRMATVSGQAG
jgi:hypothetical protein